MPTPRLYQNISLSEGKTLELSLEASHYLGTVRRLHEGDPLIIFNGQGGEYKAEIQAIARKTFTIKLLSFHDVNKESPLDVILAQGVARGEKMDFIVQKAVELGVKKIIPVFTERSTVRLETDKRTKRRDHWQMIANSACEQSGRNFVPEVLLPVDLPQWLKTFSGEGIILSPYSQHKISDLKVTMQNPLTLLIGPEGGLSEDEVLLCQKKDFLSINLGPRILRTETASLAVLAALQARFGDMV